MHAGTTVFITQEVPPKFIKLVDSQGNLINDMNIMKKKSKTKKESDEQPITDNMTEASKSSGDAKEDVSSEVE